MVRSLKTVPVRDQEFSDLDRNAAAEAKNLQRHEDKRKELSRNVKQRIANKKSKVSGSQNKERQEEKYIAHEGKKTGQKTYVRPKRQKALIGAEGMDYRKWKEVTLDAKGNLDPKLVAKGYEILDTNPEAYKHILRTAKVINARERKARLARATERKFPKREQIGSVMVTPQLNAKLKSKNARTRKRGEAILARLQQKAEAERVDNKQRKMQQQRKSVATLPLVAAESSTTAVAQMHRRDPDPEIDDATQEEIDNINHDVDCVARRIFPGRIDQLPTIQIPYRRGISFNEWLVENPVVRKQLTDDPLCHVEFFVDGNVLTQEEMLFWADRQPIDIILFFGRLTRYRSWAIHKKYNLTCCVPEAPIYTWYYQVISELDEAQANGPFDTIIAGLIAKVREQLLDSIPHTIMKYAYFVEAIFSSVTFVVAAYEYSQGRLSGVLMGMMAATFGTSLVGRAAAVGAVAQGGKSISNESIVASIWKFFSNVFTNDNSDIEKDAERQKRISSITSMFQSIEKILSNLGEFLLTIFKHVYAWIRGEPYVSAEDAFKFGKLLDLCVIFSNELANEKVVLKSKILNTQVAARRVYLEKYIEERDYLLRTYATEAGINVIFQRCESIFEEWKKKIYERAVAQLQQTVRQPASFIILAGYPGAGKSNVQSLLTAPYGPGDLYTISKESDFWEGYHGQRGVIIDDLFQSVAAEDRKKAAIQLIELCSDNPKNLNMAFDSKGSVFFNSQFIIATTNVMVWNNMQIASMGAVLRRVTKFVWVEPRKEVATLTGEKGHEFWKWNQTVDENKKIHPDKLWRLRECKWQDDNSLQWTVTDKELSFEDVRLCVHAPVRTPLQPDEYLEWLARPVAQGKNKRGLGDIFTDIGKFAESAAGDVRRFFQGTKDEEYEDTDEPSLEQYDYDVVEEIGLRKEGTVDINFFQKVINEINKRHALFRRDTTKLLDSLATDLNATKELLLGYKEGFLTYTKRKPWVVAILVTGLASVFTLIGKLVYDKLRTRPPVLAEGSGVGYSDQPPPALDKARILVDMNAAHMPKAEANRQLADAYGDVLRRTFYIELYDNARQAGDVYGYAMGQGTILTVAHIFHQNPITMIKFTNGTKTIAVPLDDMKFQCNEIADIMVIKLSNPKYSLPGVREGEVNCLKSQAFGELHTLRFVNGVPTWHTLAPRTYEYRSQVSYRINAHVQATNNFCLQYGHVPSDYGDCGLPIFAVGNDGVSLVGIHVASDITTCYAIHVKGWEPVAQGRNKVPHLKHPESYNIEIVRTVPRNQATTLPTETRIKRSEISHLLPWAPEMFPARLSPFMSAGSLISPLHNSMKNHYDRIQCPYTSGEVRQFTDHFCEIPVVKINPVSPYDIHRSPYVQKSTWNLNASPGLPWTKMGYTKVRDLYDGDELKEKVRNSINEIVNSKDFGRCIFTASLKDEKIKAAKAMNGSTRMFYGAPFEFTYIGKYLLGPYADYMHGQACKKRSFSAVGINPHGPEWTLLAEKHGSFTKHFDGDSAKHDRRCQPWFATLFYVHVSRVYENLCDRVWFAMISTLLLAFLEHIFNTEIMLGTLVYRMKCGLVSGHPITSLLNTFIISFTYFVALKDVNNGAIPSDFFDHIAFTAYGDDHILSTDLDIDINKIVSYVQKSGLVISDAKKTERICWTSTEGNPNSLNGVVFLKRQFIRYDKMPVYSAPLEKATLLAMPHWIMKNREIDDYTMTRNVVDAFIRELVHQENFGAEYYKAIVEACAQVGIPLEPYDFKTMYNSLYTARLRV